MGKTGAKSAATYPLTLHCVDTVAKPGGVLSQVGEVFYCPKGIWVESRSICVTYLVRSRR